MKVGSPSIPSSLRLGLKLIIALMVITSPILLFLNPVSISAKSSGSNNVDTSNLHSAFSLKDTSSSSPLAATSPTNISPMDSDFTTQAALTLTRASQTSNIVNSKAYYDISFRTTTAGVIKTIEMDFPSGTYVGSALLVEATGIGTGTIAADNVADIITYTVTNAVNVPANTIIRIQIANINNPPSAIASLTVSITTRDSANAPIDGPTATFAYNMKQIGTADIANNAVTTPKMADSSVTTPKMADSSITLSKPAESFMKKVTVFDDPAGNAKGWNPDGVATRFNINEPLAGNPASEGSNAVVNVVDAGNDPLCGAGQAFNGIIQVVCATAPEPLAALDYTIINLPPNPVE